MSERTKRLSRRNFLLTAGAGSAAAAAAAIVTKNSPQSQLDSSKDKRATRGYHATEHVNNYYRTTKL